VEEVDPSKGASYEGIYFVANVMKPHLCALSYMREDISLTKLNQSKLGIIAVSKEI
jgi:hypothetical protein